MNPKFKSYIDRAHRENAWTELLLEKIMLEEEMLDEDGYPTNAALDIIEYFSYKKNPLQWFEFIHSIWHLKSWGFTKEEFHDSTLFRISTAGWSGNETVIRSMEKNWMLWSETFYSHTRGGHYIFEVEKELA